MSDTVDFTRHQIAVAAAFATQGLVFIVLSTKLPALQDRLDIGPREFPALLLALLVAADFGSLIAERTAPRYGNAAILRAGFVAMVLALPVTPSHFRYHRAPRSRSPSPGGASSTSGLHSSCSTWLTWR
ncbi:MAG: hypothetical protein M3Y49_08795 [Actinomycetota bacterium]|nr:hypothetical protein [Actinomycetota bacterium]